MLKRCIEIGLSIIDLGVLTISMVLDLLIKKLNYDVKYEHVAWQEEFDKF